MSVTKELEATTSRVFTRWGSNDARTAEACVGNLTEHLPRGVIVGTQQGGTGSASCVKPDGPCFIFMLITILPLSSKYSLRNGGGTPHELKWSTG
jgi:hypothetical protein